MDIYIKCSDYDKDGVLTINAVVADNSETGFLYFELDTEDISNELVCKQINANMMSAKMMYLVVSADNLPPDNEDIYYWYNAVQKRVSAYEFSEAELDMFAYNIAKEQRNKNRADWVEDIRSKLREDYKNGVVSFLAYSQMTTIYQWFQDEGVFPADFPTSETDPNLVWWLQNAPDLLAWGNSKLQQGVISFIPEKK